jgi:uncharacterized protein YjeT (DUF2065 family)
MAVGTIMPLPRFTGFDANGDPVPGGQLWTYVAGTSTPAITYSDVGLTVAHANPIVLNTAGRPASGGSELGVYLTPGSSYKFVLQDAQGATLWTQDNVAAVPSASQSVDSVGTAGEALTAGQAVYLSDGQGGRTAGFWYRTDSDIVYQSVQPRVVGLATATIAAGAQGAIRTEGALVVPGANFTPGATYYVDATTGAITTSVAQTFLRAIGVAQDVTTMLVGAGVGVQPYGISFTTALTGLQHNLAIPAGCSVVYLLGTSGLQLTGIAAGLAGQVLTLVNISNGQVDLLNLNAGSSAGNRLQNLATSGPTSLAQGSSASARYIYDATFSVWRLEHHEQGAWLSIPYNAANFTGNGGMTWTVDAGDVTALSYRLNGRTLQINIALATTSVGGTLSNSLTIGGVPYTAAKAATTLAQLSDNAARLAGILSISAGTASLSVLRIDAVSFSAATNTTLVFGSLTYEVT